MKQKTNFQVMSIWGPDSKLSIPNGKAPTQMKALSDKIHPFQLNFLMNIWGLTQQHPPICSSLKMGQHCVLRAAIQEEWEELIT